MLTATSTEFLLLIEKVNYLNNSFNWVVGSIGIVIAIALGGIGFMTIFYNKKFINEEAKDLKKEVTDILTKTIEQEVKSMQALIEENTSSMRMEMESERQSMQANIDRTYALNCQEKKLYALAFGWWLSAATNFDKYGEEKLTSMSIKSAKDCLENIIIGDQINIKGLWEKMTDYNQSISLLAVKHPIEAKLISELMSQKAGLSEKRSEPKL